MNGKQAKALRRGFNKVYNRTIADAIEFIEDDVLSRNFFRRMKVAFRIIFRKKFLTK